VLTHDNFPEAQYLRHRGSPENVEWTMSSKSIQTWGAVTTMVGVAMFVMVVFILNLLQPEYDPRTQFLSELALGRHGWAMFLAFLGLAAAMFGVQAAIAVYGGARGYRFLLVTAAFMFLAAGVFPLGAASMLHISAIAIAFVLSVLAMYLFPVSAGLASAAAPRAVSWPLAAGVASSVALGHSLIPMGIGQRLAAACLLVWLGTVGWKLFRLQNKPQMVYQAAHDATIYPSSWRV